MNFKQYFVFVFFLLTISNLNAADSTNSKILFDVQLNVWLNQMTGTYGSPYGNLDLQDRLGFDGPYIAAELTFSVGFPSGNSLEINYLNHISTASQFIGELRPDPDWKKRTFPIANQVTINSRFDNSLFGVVFQHSLWKNQTANWGLRYGAYRLVSGLTLTFDGIVENETQAEDGFFEYGIITPGVFPVVGTFYTNHLNKKWHLKSFTEGLFIKLDNIIGKAFHGSLLVEREIKNNWFIGLSGRYFYMDVNVEIEDRPKQVTTIHIFGIMLNISKSF